LIEMVRPSLQVFEVGFLGVSQSFLDLPILNLKLHLLLDWLFN
jgi:hypothetical protein